MTAVAATPQIPLADVFTIIEKIGAGGLPYAIGTINALEANPTLITAIETLNPGITPFINNLPTVVGYLNFFENLVKPAA